MQVPIYQRQVNQEGLPGVKQQSNVHSAQDFINPQAALAANNIGQLANQVFDIGMHHIAQQRQIADQAIVKDGIAQYQKHLIDSQYGTPDKPGWLTVTGKDAFKQPDGRLLSDHVIDDNKKVAGDISLSLGTDQQRAVFSDQVNQMDLHTYSQLKGHEAQQYRVFQRSTLEADTANQIRSIGLNNNDPNSMNESYNKIIANHVELSRLQGESDDFGKITGEKIGSDAIKGSIGLALQRADHPTALNILNQFNSKLDANDRISTESAIGDSAAADMAQSNPQRLYQEMSSNPLIEAIRKQESNGKDTNAKGEPLISSDGKSMYSMQVTGDTARDPGFGIDPAKDSSAQEYNRIGHQLIEKYQAKYNGDPEKIAAAYNAGSGAVDEAIKKGGDNWQEHIPESTKNTYIPNVLNNLKTNNPLDLLTSEQRRNWQNRAESEINRGQAVFSSQLKNDISNQYAQASATGKTGTLIPKESFMQAFGKDADKEYENYQDQINHAQQFFGISTLPTDKAVALVNASKPIEGDNFEREQKQYLSLASALDHAQDERLKDPVLAAQQKGFGVDTLPKGNIDNLAQALNARVASMAKFSQDYQVPMTLFSKQEASDLANHFNSLSIDDTLNTSVKLSKTLSPPVFNEVMQTLRKDSPVTALAGKLAAINTTYQDSSFFGLRHNTVEANGYEAAKLALIGENILNKTKSDKTSDGKPASLFMPDNETLRQTFDNVYAKAFAGSPEKADQAFQLTRAIYAGLAAKNGITDAKHNSDSGELLNKAATMAMGGTPISINSSSVLAPYGMPEYVFKDKLSQGFKDASSQLGVDTYEHSMSSFNVIPISDGVYGFADGDLIRLKVKLK